MGLTTAQRHNRMLDKVYDEYHQSDSYKTMLIEELVLEMVDLSTEVSRSDLQGIVAAEATKLLKRINK